MSIQKQRRTESWHRSMASRPVPYRHQVKGVTRKEFYAQQDKDREKPKHNVRPSHVYSGIARHG